MTVPTNSDHAIQAVRDRKMNKPNTDQHLIGELENRGLNVSFRTLEIGFLGHHERHAIHCICHTFNLPKHDANQILLKLARTSVSCSYHIFNSRNSLSWDSNKPFTAFEIELFKTNSVDSISCCFSYVFTPCTSLCLAKHPPWWVYLVHTSSRLYCSFHALL